MRKKGQPVERDGDRVQRMRKWLYDNRDKIMQPRKGAVTFNFAGPKVSVKFEELEEKI